MAGACSECQRSIDASLIAGSVLFHVRVLMDGIDSAVEFIALLTIVTYSAITAGVVHSSCKLTRSTYNVLHCPLNDT